MAYHKSPSRANTAVLFVTYRPDPGFGERLARIAGQTDAVLIVDNTPGALDPQLDGLASQTIEIIKNPNNEGLGVALNQGMKRAIERGFAWVLTLDQDTLVDLDMLERLCEIASAYPGLDTLALVASNARSHGSGRLYLRSNAPHALYREVKTPMTSGSLTSVAAFQTIGGFREDFFIGSIDLEYCLRARAHGFHILCSERALMNHASGDTQERNFFGRRVLIGEQSLLRWYLDFRNVAWTLRCYCFKEPAWAAATLWGLTKRFMLLFLYEAKRIEKAKAILLGVRDGLFHPWGHPLVPSSMALKLYLKPVAMAASFQKQT